MSETKPNVLFITRRFPPSVGGMERFAFDLAGALNPKTELRLIKWGGSNKFLPIILPVFFIRAFWILLTKKVDVIHAQDGVVSIICMPLKFMFRKSMTAVIHGLDITYRSKFYQFLVKRSLRTANHIFCISNMAVDEVVERGIQVRKVSFVPLGVTDDLYIANKSTARQEIIKELKLDIDAKIIMSNGRLVKRKGVAWFVNNVMPQLVKNNEKVILVVSGDAPEKPIIEEAIKLHGLEKHVYLLGRTNDTVLKNLYNGSDIFVMPNIRVEGDREGFGRVVLEAALCELPVLATGIEGIVDAITDGQNGLLVNEKDVDDFVRKAEKLLNDASYSQKLGKSARQFTLKNFDWGNIAKQYIDKYKKL